jgi:hypothetical protein
MITIEDMLKDIERQIDEGCNSYNNTIYLLALLAGIEERTYYSNPEMSGYAKKLIKKILGE